MQIMLPVITGTIAIFLALFVPVAFSPKICRSLIAAAAGIVVVVGLIFYSICFSSIFDQTPFAILQTCYALFCSFLGESITDVIWEAPLMQNRFLRIIPTMLSVLGIFATVGAAVSVIGAKFLTNARLFLQRSKELAVIHPLTPSTLEFAKELIELGGQKIVFVDENPDTACASTAEELGCVIRSDTGAVSANARFLRSIGISKGRRRIHLYVLSPDLFANGSYASRFLGALQQRGIQPKQTSLTVFAEEDAAETAFAGGDYHYGQVLCVNEEYIAARLLMKKAPPYESMSFDANCRATEDFHALVVGSGNVGQAVIKQLVMNGQFVGSHFRLDVFDPNFDSVTGKMHHECGLLFDQYDIRVHHADARSDQMFEFLSENWNRLKYIVVCTGADDSNRDIIRQINHFLTMHQCNLPLYICSTRGVQRFRSNQSERWDVYSSQVLCSDALDRMAMLLNHYYCNNNRSIQENWENCDSFSRMSNRASADFAPAYLKMAGMDIDMLPEGNWVSGQRLDNLAITEHERWCAFHYCMGFRPMTREEFQARGQIYRKEKEKDPDTRYRIGKDISMRIHCCLIPWDALDDLSALEKEYTGKDPQYKKSDVKNVLALPELLKVIRE